MNLYDNVVWAGQKSDLPHQILFMGRVSKQDHNNFTYSSHGISHFDDKSVCSIGTRMDGISPASNKSPGPTTLIHGSQLTVQPMVRYNDIVCLNRVTELEKNLQS